MQTNDIIKEFAKAVQEKDDKLFPSQLSSDGIFEIEDDSLAIIEANKSEFIEWLTSKLNKTDVYSVIFDQCLDCRIGNPVILFNDGTFPRTTTESSERSKTGLMLEVKDNKISYIKFCFVFLEAENKFNFECNAEKIKQQMKDGATFDDAYKQIFKNELSNSQKYDIATSVNNYGFNATFDALEALNNELKTQLQNSGSLDKEEEQFEFELFAFSYYIAYLKKVRPSFGEIMNNMAVNWFSESISDFINDNSKNLPSYIFPIENNKNYIECKMDAYQNEINKINSDSSYLSTFILYSLYFYPMMKTGAINENCNKITKNDISLFQIALNSTLKILNDYSINVLKYVDM